ncbi:ribitol-5-phosphate transferase FKTN-like [Branchiostoma floridae x Branchiostoma belcheri]
MCVWRRRYQRCFIFLLIASTLSLIFQIWFIHSNPQFQGSAFQGMVNKWLNPGNKHAQETLKLFVKHTSQADLPLFLMDPAVLSAVRNSSHGAADERRGTQHCRYLCSSQGVITLGLLGDSHIKLKPDLLQGLHGDGFQYVITEGHDPRLASVASMAAGKVPHHMLFRRHDTVIHIVVLYERPGKFLWHAAVEPENTQKWTSLIGDRELQFGEHEGAYDKMEIVPTKLDGVKLNIPKDPAAFLQQIPHARFLECDYEQARKFQTAYGSDQTVEGVEFVGKAKRLLSQGKAVLDRIGVRFWMSSGTCLGWFRQCGIIPHSKDVDFGIWIKDYRDTLIPAFQAAGLSLKHRFGKVEDSFELSFQSGDVKLDIFFFYEEDDIMWNGGTQARTGKKFKYIFPRFTLCWTEFLDMKVRVPCQTLAYIQANYGANWYEPVKQWDWKNSPPNVQPNGQWPEEEWPEVIQLFDVR